MDEYINRQDAVEAAQHAWAKGIDPSQYIEIIPAADVATVRHGRWRFCGSDRWNDAYECDNCGKMSTDNSNYCPNCGAKMDGEQ